MLQTLPHYQGTLPALSPCPIAFKMHVYHITDVSTDVADQPPYWLLHNGHSSNALSPVNLSTIFSTVWTAYNSRLFLNCDDVTKSPSLQCQLKFLNKEWSHIWTEHRMQNSHAILYGSHVGAQHSNSLPDLLHCTYWNTEHFGDRFGPILRLASCKTTATTWWPFTL